RETLPTHGCLVADVYLPVLRRGEHLAAFVFDGDWTDIGTPESYLAANLRVLGSSRRLVDIGASVDADVALDEAVVGEGARITGRGAIRRCVVWPRAEATAPLERSIVTTAGRIVAV